VAKVLIVVDMQNDFVSGQLSTIEARGIVGAVREKIEAYQSSGGAVLFTLDTHQDGDYVEQDPAAEAAALPKHGIKGTEGWEIIGELRSYAAKDNSFEKPTFLGLGLEALLAEKIADTAGDTIELCGVCTDICVISNALYLRAKYPRAKIIVDAGACAGVTPEAHKAALTTMKSCLINVID